MTNKSAIVITELAGIDGHLASEVSKLLSTAIYDGQHESDILESLGDATHTLLAFNGDETLIGAASITVSDGRADIGEIGVVPSSRNQRIGSKLMKAAEDIAITNGAEVLCAAPTSKAEGFYEKLGYVLVTGTDKHIQATKTLR